jgi:hypothetical protein
MKTITVLFALMAMAFAGVSYGADSSNGIFVAVTCSNGSPTKEVRQLTIRGVSFSPAVLETQNAAVRVDGNQLFVGTVLLGQLNQPFQVCSDYTADAAYELAINPALNIQVESSSSSCTEVTTDGFFGKNVSASITLSDGTQSNVLKTTYEQIFTSIEDCQK